MHDALCAVGLVLGQLGLEFGDALGAEITRHFRHRRVTRRRFAIAQIAHQLADRLVMLFFGEILFEVVVTVGVEQTQVRAKCPSTPSCSGVAVNNNSEGMRSASAATAV